MTIIKNSYFKKMYNNLNNIHDEMGAERHKPHYIVFYLQELATAFHSGISNGKKNPAFRTIISNNIDLTMARLGINYAVKQIIINGLSLLGVEPIEKM